MQVGLLCPSISISKDFMFSLAEEEPPKLEDFNAGISSFSNPFTRFGTTSRKRTHKIDKF